MAKSRHPKYYLIIKDKDNKNSRTTAGALWENEYGGFSLKLNPGIVLKWDDNVFFNVAKPRSDYGRGAADQSEVEVPNPDGVQYGDERADDLDDTLDYEDLANEPD